jgi:hypothetical protein
VVCKGLTPSFEFTDVIRHSAIIVALLAPEAPAGGRGDT